MHEHSCWQCGSEEAGSLFCRYCNSLQQPTPDYYEFFGIPKHLTIAQEDLQTRFYALSRKLHPDLYTRKSEAERSYSLEATAILNDGYRVLKDPFLRAEYVLRENGFDIGEQRSKDVPAELLEEVFELNMALDELRSGDVSVLPQLETSRAHFVRMLEAIDGELVEQFRRHDAQSSPEHRQAILGGIRSVLNRRRYIRNLVSEVDKELSRRSA